MSLIDVVALLCPFLDTECKDLLYNLCHTIRNGYRRLLMPQPTEADLSIACELVTRSLRHDTITTEEGGFRYIVKPISYGSTLSVAIAMYYNCQYIGTQCEIRISDVQDTGVFQYHAERVRDFFDEHNQIPLPTIKHGDIKGVTVTISRPARVPIQWRFQEDLINPWQTPTKQYFHLKTLCFNPISEPPGDRHSDLDEALNSIELTGAFPTMILLPKFNPIVTFHTICKQIRDWAAAQSKTYNIVIHCLDGEEYIPIWSVRRIVAPVFATHDSFARLRRLFAGVLSYTGLSRLDVYLLGSQNAFEQFYLTPISQVHDGSVVTSGWPLERKLAPAPHRYSLGRSFKNAFGKFVEYDAWPALEALFDAKTGPTDWIHFSAQSPQLLPWPVVSPTPTLPDDLDSFVTHRNFAIHLVNPSETDQEGRMKDARIVIRANRKKLRLESYLNGKSDRRWVNLSRPNLSGELEGLELEFELLFFLLTGNYWHNVPTRFEHVKGAFRPWTPEDALHDHLNWLAPQPVRKLPSHTQVQKRDQSPKRSTH